MQHQKVIKPIGEKLVSSKTIFAITIVVIVLTILSIWLFGLGQRRTIFENSLLSTSILSITFFLFLTIGLYRGIKLKDTLGNLTDKVNIDKIAGLSDSVGFSMEVPDIGDDIAGILFGILSWFLFSILLLLFVWFFGSIIWTFILVFAAMLYWIFFRALRLVFKNSNKCQGDFKKSVLFALGYTTLYNFWIYGIILITHYLI